MRLIDVTRFGCLLILISLWQGGGQPLAGQTIPQKLMVNKPVGRALRADESHTYALDLQRKQVMQIKFTQQGTEATIQVTNAAGRPVFHLEALTNEYGDESFTFQAPQAGRHTVTVRPSPKSAFVTHYTIELSEVLSGEVYAARVAEARRQRTAVINWLKTRSMPLRTLVVDPNRADLAPLKAVLRDVRIVGLGEQTHGTHEFFQVKHRLLDFLVREMGFRVLVIEGSYAGWQQINDYVTGKSNDGDRALTEQGFWAWNTEEMKAVIDWARQYNENVPATEQLRFVGIDPQFNQPAKTKLLDYLRRTAPERVAPTAAFFALEPDSLTSIGQAADTLAALQSLYNELGAYLEERRQSNTDTAEARQMQEYVRVLAQDISTYADADSVGVAARDRIMAANFRRLVDREPPGTRFVFWGHNGHVATGGNSLFKPVGAYLRETYDSAYYALGFSFNAGTFRAREVPTADSSRRRLKEFTARPAPRLSVDWYLAQNGQKNVIIDFRAAPQTAASRAWLAEPLLMRSIGSVYRSAVPSAYFYPVQLNERFDGLLFVTTSTGTHPATFVKDVPEDAH
ncbi:erythromycin esterase family protein [Spirosoma pomorum]